MKLQNHYSTKPLQYKSITEYQHLKQQSNCLSDKCSNDQVPKCSTDKRGVAALLTVIIVSAAALLIAFSASILGIGEMDMGYTAQKGQESYSFASGCAEETLRKLQFDNNWTGATLSFSEGLCIISVTSSLNNRTVLVTANTGNFIKKLQLSAIVSSSLVTVNSWQEVEN